MPVAGPYERQKALGFAGAGAFLGLPLGPLVAGFLLTHYEWGSIFLINAPVVVIAVVGTWFFVPESKCCTTGTTRSWLP